MTTKRKEVTKSVKVSRLVTPQFLTLTEKPANQVAFKIVRRDRKGQEAEPKPKIISRQRPVRRMAPTLVMEFPATATEEQIAGLMKEFGIDDYKIEKRDDVWLVMRSDLAELPSSYVTIHLKDGVKAWVTQGEVVASDDNPLPHIGVAYIHFDKARFPDETAVQEWLTRNGVDISESQIDNTNEKAVVVTRLKVEPDVEIKTCGLENGIEVGVVRAAKQDVPSSMVEVVSESMYGTWGWGQLDFSAAMADIEFSQVTREAVDVLYRLLENILFYSPLPLSVRKELVDRATGQFAAFIGALLDALPARVLVSQTSDEENHMSKKDQQPNAAEAAAEEAKRKAGDVTAAKAYLETEKVDPKTLEGKTDDELIALAATHRAEKEKQTAPVTRTEVEEIVKTSITAAVGPAVTEALRAVFAPQQRSDEKTDAKPENKEPDLGTQIGETLRSAVEPVVKAMGDVTKSVSDLAERVAKVEGATTVRTDSEDPKQGKNKPDVFAGVFRRGGKSE